MKEMFWEKKKLKRAMREESGSVVILAALALTVLMMFTALAVDFGLLYLQESKLQTACDAAALAAASKYNPNDCSSETKARQEAQKIMEANGFDMSDCNIKFDSVAKTVEVTKKISVKTSFAQIMNINFMKSEKSAKAAAGDQKKEFQLDYALFQAATDTSLNIGAGSVRVDGNVHTNHDLQTWNEVEILGTAECKNHYNSGNFNRYNPELVTVKTNYPDVPIPDYDQSIMAKVPTSYSIHKTSLAQYRHDTGQDSSNPIAINGNVILDTCENLGAGIDVIINGNVKVMDAGTPEFGGNVTINEDGGIYCESGGLNIVGNLNMANGYIIAEQGINIQGLIDDCGTALSGQSVIYSKGSDGIVIKGATATLWALLYAPNGIINFQYYGGGSYNIHGGLIADQVLLNQGSFYIWKDYRAWEMEMDTTPGTGTNGSNVKLVG